MSTPFTDAEIDRLIVATGVARGANREATLREIARASGLGDRQPTTEELQLLCYNLLGDGRCRDLTGEQRRQIAAAVGVTPASIPQHLRRIAAEMGVTNRNLEPGEMRAYCQQNGYDPYCMMLRIEAPRTPIACPPPPVDGYPGWSLILFTSVSAAVGVGVGMIVGKYQQRALPRASTGPRKTKRSKSP